MLIAHFLRALIAVLSLAAVFSPAFASTQEQPYINETFLNSSIQSSTWYQTFYDKEEEFGYAGDYLSVRANQMLLKRENQTRENGADCCPTILEMVQPEAGKNQADLYVELYKDGNIKQRFYELSCHQDFLNKPCRFMERKLHSNSKCVQKYSYSYALVKDQKHNDKNASITGASGQQHETRWTLDYIQVRSGCTCVVQPNENKKMLNSKYKHRRRHMIN